MWTSVRESQRDERDEGRRCKNDKPGEREGSSWVGNRPSMTPPSRVDPACPRRTGERIMWRPRGRLIDRLTGRRDDQRLVRNLGQVCDTRTLGGTMDCRE